MVQKVKRKEETGVAYMQLYEYVQREAWAAAREAAKEAEEKGREKWKAEGKAEGKTEGRAEGKAEAILLLLEEKDNVPSELKERIMSEKDEEKLKEWLKAAAQSDSIESFRENV